MCDQRTIWVIKQFLNRPSLSPQEQNVLNSSLEKYTEAMLKMPSLDVSTTSESDTVFFRIPDMKTLLRLLSQLKRIYRSADHNFAKFRADLIHHKEYQVFNILVGFRDPDPSIVTYDYFDKLAIHLFLNWCYILNKKIPSLNSLFIFVDNL